MPQETALTPLKDARPPFFVGVDLGGTSIKIGMVDDLGRPVHHFSIPTEIPRGPEDGARRMGQGVLRALEETRLKKRDVGGVGLGTPGTMDVPAGMLIRPHNLPGWYDFPIRDRVSHHCGLSVTYANDANAAAYGEFWVGRGRDFHSMVLLTLGTGVGGGIIIGDLCIDGENSHGGELGHVIIDYNETARRCPCGQLGHLEAYASATAVIARTKEALGLKRAKSKAASANVGGRNWRQPSAASKRSTSLWPRIHAGEKLTPLMLAQEAEAGDAFSLRMIDDTARYLGIGIVNFLHTIDPAGVVLGGQMTFGGNDKPLGRRFLAGVKKEVQQRAFPVIAQRITVDFATLGGNAGFIGVAGLARLAHQRSNRQKRANPKTSRRKAAR
jgi:glucokinase